MAVIDDIIRTTQKIGKAVAETATDVYGYTKTSYSIASLENKLKNVLADIGHYMLEKETVGTEETEKYEAYIAQAKELAAKIQEEKAKRGEIVNQKICPKCSQTCDKNAEFCSKCGEKL
ncbi:MAG: zinc ribbon domain-containing protein [Clostridia bacterium]|nr:zinc ribbon domain-containing protein [Clostridia bacterium]